MAYFGYIEVEVRLMRQGHGEDSSGELGSGFGVHAERKLRIEEHEARDLLKARLHPGGLARFRGAVAQVLDEDEMGDMRERWRKATEHMTPETIRKALEVLES